MMFHNDYEEWEFCLHYQYRKSTGTLVSGIHQCVDLDDALEVALSKADIFNILWMRIDGLNGTVIKDADEMQSIYDG